MATNGQSSELSNLISTLEKVDKNSFPNDVDQHAALIAARALVTRLEKPRDTLIYQTWILPTLCGTIRTGINMGLFAAMDANGGKPETSANLAKAVGADEGLVQRLLKAMAANSLVTETDARTFAATEYTSALNNRLNSSLFDFLYDLVGPCTLLRLPKFFEKHGYNTSWDTADGPFQFGMESELEFFPWLAAHPEEANNFSLLLTGSTRDRGDWTEVYPVKQLIPDGGAEGETLVVDVGGNNGADFERLVHKHPLVKGRLVVQDLEHILKSVTVNERFEAMPHDFFTEQPVKGARAYFMHSILHDWPDETCIRILGNLKPAFSKHSKLLLCEIVIPEVGPTDPQSTAMDWVLMSLLNTGERTERMWRDLLKQAGFTVTRIYNGRQSVIEAVVS